MDSGVAGAERLDDLELAWSAASDVGKVRRLNEDSFLAHPGLFLVADGMGGHAAGDVASRIAVEVFEEQLAALPLVPADVERLVTEANRRVRQRADAEDTEGMGTTLVGLALVDNGGAASLMVFNIGDSRCYAWSDESGLELVTKDHSVVQELVDAGAISSSDAKRHPDRNVVTRAIGVEPTAAADFTVLPRAARQRFLLCSDGVSGQLDPEQIARCLADEHAPREGAATLVAQVLDGPATDNATCIVVDVRWASPLATRSEADEDVTGPRPKKAKNTDVAALIRGVPGELVGSQESEPATAPISEVPR